MTLLFSLISSQIRVSGMMESEWQDKTLFDGYMYYCEDGINELKPLLTNKKLNLEVQIKDFTYSNNSTEKYNYSFIPIISQRKFIENQLINFKKNIGNLGIIII